MGRLSKLALIIGISSALISLAYWYEQCGFVMYDIYIDKIPGKSDIPAVFKSAFEGLET